MLVGYNYMSVLIFSSMFQLPFSFPVVLQFQFSFGQVVNQLFVI